jgi:hypothetical protein
MIVEGKTRVEQKVKLVKSYYKIGDDEYTKTRDLYIDAQAGYERG